MNKYYYNHPDLKNRRRDLRRKSTVTEDILWQQLRSSKLGYKFRRQYSISGYVLDFFCPEERLAIEIEGGIHNTNEQIIYDNYRFRFLESLDIKIFRVKNMEIITDVHAVCSKITDYLNPSHKVGEGTSRFSGMGVR